MIFKRQLFVSAIVFVLFSAAAAFPAVGTLLMADTLARWTPGRLFLYDMKTGTADTLSRSAVFGACFSPDGHKVAYVGSTGGRIKIVDVISKQVDSIGNPLAWKFTLSWANDNCIYYSQEYGKVLLKINVETEQVDTVYRMQMTYNNLAKITDVASFYTGNVCADGTRGAYTVLSDQIGNRGVSFDFVANMEMMINDGADTRLSCQATMSSDGQWVGVANYNHTLGFIKPYNSNGAAYRTIACSGIWLLHFAYNSSSDLVYKSTTDNGTYHYNLSTTVSELILQKGCAWAFDARGWVLDTVSPAAPTNLSANLTEHSVALTWTAPSTGSRLPTAYIVERDGVKLTKTTSTTYIDKAVLENTSYTYTVYGSTDGVGLSSPLTGTYQTPVDHNPPSLLAAYCFGTAVDLLFSETLDSSSVSSLSNYTLPSPASISSAALTTPNHVRLTASSAITTLSDSMIVVRGVKDVSPAQNTTVSTTAPITIVKDLWSSTGRMPRWETVDSGALVWYDDSPPEARIGFKAPLYTGLPYFQTSWRDGTADSTQDYIRFNVNRRVEVLVSGPPPAWLNKSNGWTNTGTVLNGPVYSKVFEAGTISIKGCGLGNFNTFIVVLRNADGSGTIVEDSRIRTIVSPTLKLSPSPFQSSTNIAYSLATGGHTKLAVYDSHGRLVQILADGVGMGGTHSVIWNGDNLIGRKVSNGIYFCRLYVNKRVVSTQRIVFVR
jgi:hypothetical protein